MKCGCTNNLDFCIRTIYPEECYANAYCYETISEFQEHYEFLYDYPVAVLELYCYLNKETGEVEVFNSNLDHQGYVIPWVSLKGLQHLDTLF